MAAEREVSSPEPGELGFLLRQITPHRPTLVFATALLCLESGIALTVPWLAGRVTEAIISGQRVGYFLLVWLGLIGVQCAFGFATSFVLGRAGVRLLAQLTLRLFDHLQSLPLAWHQDQRRGEVVALLTNDVYRVSSFVTATLVPLLPTLLTFAGASILMLTIEPWIAVASALLVPVFFLVLKIVGRRVRPLSTAAVREYAAQVGLLEQNLGMLPLIKAFTGEPAESERFQAQTQRVLELDTHQLRIQSLLAPATRFVGVAALVLLLWFASPQLATGALSPADLMRLLLYGLLLVQPMSALAGVYGQVQMARGAATRLIEAFGQEPEPAGTGLPDLPPLRGDIEFDGISFRYPGRERLFDGTTLSIRAGETVAFTGPNGAGKTTLAHLLMRFHDPESGRILVDGHDLRSVSLGSLRAQIGLVAQNVLLFNGTVAENIRYGRLGASPADLERAARAARAHDFVAQLPHGYETRIGDDGIKLSGGQKQRIALARALLKDPPILILDEATAMFDPVGEEELLRECREVLRTRTVILITHRPASLALADRVVAVGSR